MARTVREVPSVPLAACEPAEADQPAGLPLAENGEHSTPELLGEVARHGIGVFLVTADDDGVPAEGPDAKHNRRNEAIGSTHRARTYVHEPCSDPERGDSGGREVYEEVPLVRFAAKPLVIRDVSLDRSRSGPGISPQAHRRTHRQQPFRRATRESPGGGADSNVAGEPTPPPQVRTRVVGIGGARGGICGCREERGLVLKPTGQAHE
jgi:hypothetical protein